MKKLITLLTLVATLQAETTTGEVAVETVQEAGSSNWQNWTFAAIAIVTATVGIWVVSLDNGRGVD